MRPHTGIDASDYVARAREGDLRSCSTRSCEGNFVVFVCILITVSIKIMFCIGFSMQAFASDFYLQFSAAGVLAKGGESAQDGSDGLGRPVREHPARNPEV